MTTSRQPTPQGISALLRKAGYERSQSASGRGACKRPRTEGYTARTSHLCDGSVEVNHFAGTSTSPGYWRRGATLDRYAEAIRSAGWTVTTGTGGRLLVKANATSPKANA